MSTQSTNHPKKGSTLIIEPLRSIEEVAKVKEVLKDHPRNYAILVLGVNSNLRASDLLALKNSDVDWRKHELRLREKKTGKLRHIALSHGVMNALEAIRAESGYHFLFRSEKTGGKLDVSTLNQMLKSWCRQAGIKSNVGSHSLRKTWSYLQYTHFKMDLAIISQELNHSSMRITYRYLGIMPDDVKRLYMNEI